MSFNTSSFYGADLQFNQQQGGGSNPGALPPPPPPPYPGGAGGAGAPPPYHHRYGGSPPPSAPPLITTNLVNSFNARTGNAVGFGMPGNLPNAGAASGNQRSQGAVLGPNTASGFPSSSTGTNGDPVARFTRDLTLDELIEHFISKEQANAQAQQTSIVNRAERFLDSGKLTNIANLIREKDQTIEAYKGQAREYAQRAEVAEQENQQLKLQLQLLQGQQQVPVPQPQLAVRNTDLEERLAHADRALRNARYLEDVHKQLIEKYKTVLSEILIELPDLDEALVSRCREITQTSVQTWNSSNYREYCPKTGEQLFFAKPDEGILGVPDHSLQGAAFTLRRNDKRPLSANQAAAKGPTPHRPDPRAIVVEDQDAPAAKSKAGTGMTPQPNDQAKQAQLLAALYEMEKFTREN